YKPPGSVDIPLFAAASTHLSSRTPRFGRGEGPAFRSAPDARPGCQQSQAIGSVLIWREMARSHGTRRDYWSLASTVLRIHSERDCFAFRAARSIALRVCAVKRTGTMRPFASPFGSLGRPTLLGFFCWLKASKLLHDCRSYCCCRRC